jgi:hypothetical protein
VALHPRRGVYLEAAEERGALRFDLRVEAVVGHEVDVAQRVGGRDSHVAAAGHQVHHTRVTAPHRLYTPHAHMH